MKMYDYNSEGILRHFVDRTFDEMHGITAAFITLNEEDNISEAIKAVRPYVKRVVVIDGGSNDKTVEVATDIADYVSVITFSCHYGQQKNNALRVCNTDWVLFLDADEKLTNKLANGLKAMTDQDEYDCYAFPRIEMIDGVEYPEVYPDYQIKLFKTYCRFVRPVHEEVVGFKNKKDVDINTDMDIIHSKKLDRHIERNGAYGHYVHHYCHETGLPGKQTRETFVMPIVLKEVGDE